MTDEDMYEVAEQFGEAAKLCVLAGIDIFYYMQVMVGCTSIYFTIYES